MPRTPKVLHYVFACEPTLPNQKPWSLVHHVCVRSAVERIKPDAVFFHCNQEPGGPWWDLTRPHVTVTKVEPRTTIFGNPLLHPAHQSDVLRLEILLREGGIYLDIDVFVQRDFDDVLDNSAVMGLEGEGGSYGMANAVILAEPGAPFLRRWYEEYRWFRSRGGDPFWSEHSVQVPWKLAQEHPAEITLLDDTAFFWPLWTEDHLKLLFGPSRDLDPRATYANHLWESLAWERYLEHLTPGRVRAVDSAFHRWCRPFVADLPDRFGAPRLGERWVRAERIGRRETRLALGKVKSAVVGRLNPRMRTAAKALLRRDVTSLSGVAARVLPRAFEGWHRQRMFQTVYKERRWGEEAGSTFFSGLGSRGQAVDAYVERMSGLIAEHARALDRPVTIVDLGCGDFEVGRRLLDRLPQAAYVGCDIVPELIKHHQQAHQDVEASFRVLDMVKDPLPDGDVCLVRQVLQHLSNADITRVLPKLSKYRAVYVSEGHPSLQIEGLPNPDKPVGDGVRFDWRAGRGRGVELDQPPFDQRVEEVLRVASTPAENVVTFRVYPSQVDALEGSRG